ncbi:MAG: putative metal-binding motif-containing protein, partial [Myxococcota bacterium]
MRMVSGVYLPLFMSLLALLPALLGCDPPMNILEESLTPEPVRTPSPLPEPTASLTPTATPDVESPTATPQIDGDGDGYHAESDCDDGNPAINPDAVEACDGLDNDCSGVADDRVVLYPDADGDGIGARDSVSTS